MSGERRYPSDTLPMDREELERQLAQIRAEMPPPQPAVALDFDRDCDTPVECPSCLGTSHTLSCTYCGGTGQVTAERRNAWRVLTK